MCLRALSAYAGSSLVLTFGGVDSSTGRHRDGIDLFDPRQRGWSNSGACLPRASRGLAAAPIDEYRVLVFGGSGGRSASIVETRNWRLLPAGELSTERQHMAAVTYEGAVLSLGGVDEHEQFVDVVERYDAVTNQWQVIGQLPCAMSHMTVAAARVSTALQLDRMPVIESAATRRASAPAG
jgi:N-acetylneuraminic acid mutarotase